MTVDEIVKLMIFSGITFSMVGLSIQIMRILGGFASILSDLRKTIQNIGNASDQFVEDYKMISDAIRALSKGLTNINSGIIEPLSKFSKLASRFSKFGKNKEEEED